MRLFRPINLAIIGILQIIVQYNVIRGHMPSSVVLFEHWQFVLIVLITILAGAAGYVINDIYDVDIDAHNKPGKNVIEQISKRTGWQIYAVLVTSGAVLTILLGDPYRIPGIGVYAGATIILWAYSSYFKRQPLVGNIIVSAFAALVVYVMWLGQSINIPTGADVAFSHHIILMYTGFAFFTTLLREIVKDMEDLSGDAIHGAQTLPTIIGVDSSKIICAIITGLLVTGISYWLIQTWGNISNFASWYMAVAVILPLSIIIWFIGRANGQKAWHFISQYIKVVILMGTLFLVLI
jgi:4-hydroxybenzoate polyprenyltransferase